MRIPAVICTAARFDRVRTTAGARRLWLQACTAKNPMPPRLPTLLAPCELWASTVYNYFCMVGEESGGWGKRCGDISFDSQPLVEEIGDGSLYTDRGRIEGGRIEANQ